MALRVLHVDLHARWIHIDSIFIPRHFIFGKTAFTNLQDKTLNTL